MTKRAFQKFERNDNDHYETPEAAVLPLLPYLVRDGVHYFAEPCCGHGELIRHLEGHGLVCTVQGDIADSNRTDARTWGPEDFKSTDAVITNPPWEHYAMSGIMSHLAFFVPCWFLIDWDWLSNKRSAELIDQRCTDVVPIGRVKWIPDSITSGFDNSCWVRMAPDKEPGTPVHLWPRR